MGIRTTLTAALLLVLSPGQLLGAAEGTTPLFTVNLGTTVWTTLVFFALLTVLWRFAWGPILNAVEARERTIQAALDEAARRQSGARALLEERRRQLADARRQAGELLSEGRAAGERVRHEIEERARAEAQIILDRARSEIERERDAALDMLRRESVELALAAASRLVQEKLDQSKDRRFVERFLEELGRGREAQA